MPTASFRPPPSAQLPLAVTVLRGSLAGLAAQKLRPPEHAQPDTWGRRSRDKSAAICVTTPVRGRVRGRVWEAPSCCAKPRTSAERGARGDRAQSYCGKVLRKGFWEREIIPCVLPKVASLRRFVSPWCAHRAQEEKKNQPRDSLEITDARKTLARWNLPTPGSVLRIVHTPLFHIVTQKDPAPKGRTVPENVRLQK